MSRASSRQRLASWDAFDAAISEESSSSSSSASRGTHHDTKPESSSPLATMTHYSHQKQMAAIDDASLSLQPTDNEDSVAANYNADDDFYSVAGYTYDDCLQSSNNILNAGRRSSSLTNNAGWSFDHSEDDREGPTSTPPIASAAAVTCCSPGAAARRKRDRSEPSGAGACAAGGIKKNVSFSSALPHFPSLIEEDPIPLDEMDGDLGAAQGPIDQQGMDRTPSLLDLLAVKPSASAVGAMHLPKKSAEHLPPPLPSATSHGQQKTLVIPRVPSKIGLGSRVASDLSLSSTLSRYMSVPSNLCDVAQSSAGGNLVGGGAVPSEGDVAHIGMTDSTSSSVDGNYSPSSQSLGVANFSMHAGAEASTAAEVGADNAKDGEVCKVLPGDALCNVASYLATSELRNLSTTNADLRVHFAGPSGKHLWVDHATRRWPAILQPEEESGAEGPRQGADSSSGKANRFDDKIVEIVDRIGVTTAGLGTENSVALCKSSKRDEVSMHIQQQPNLSALLGLAAKDCPTSMSPCPMPSASEVPGRQRQIRSGGEFTVVRVADNSGYCSSAIQFTARVGEGDRSITSDAPLPRPNKGGKASRIALNGTSDADSTNKLSNSSSRWSPRLPPISVPSPTQTLITFLRSASRVSSRGDDDEDASNANGRQGNLRPFVCPYVASEDAFRTVIDMSPRLVAYYELKILPRDSVQQSSIQEDAQTAATIREGFNLPVNGVATARFSHRHRRGVPSQGPEMPPLLHLPGPALDGAAIPGGSVPLSRNLPPPRHVLGGQQHHGNGGPADGNNDAPLDAECVAIGLSTSRFRPAAKMPGWDSHSFGYHSDDGGIFHGAGDMERQYGSTYGVGDTVGCGIDYTHGEGGGSIFFTLNGKFLGYAWTNVAAISLGDDMYPTVGVDTNCPLEINFGSRPFAFDLGSFVEDQRGCIERALGPLVPSATGRNIEEECERGDDVERYLDHGLGEISLFSSSKIDEWGSLEPIPPNSVTPMAFGSGNKMNGGASHRMSGGGSVLRSTRTTSGGLRRPPMSRGHALN